MTPTFRITGARAIPQVGDLTNVIAKVSWTVAFERVGFTSFGAGETVFDTGNIEQFTPIDNLSEAQVISWVISKEGGDQFLEMLSQIHGTNITAQEINAQTQPVALPFILPADSQSPSALTVIATTRV